MLKAVRHWILYLGHFLLHLFQIGFIILKRPGLKINSIKIYLYSAFHKTYCFKAALQKVHFRNVQKKIQLVNHVLI